MVRDDVPSAEAIWPAMRLLPVPGPDEDQWRHAKGRPGVSGDDRRPADHLDGLHHVAGSGPQAAQLGQHARVGDEMSPPQGVGVVAIARERLFSGGILARRGLVMFPVAGPAIIGPDRGLEGVALHQMQAGLDR